MPIDLITLFAALLSGLFGGVHCVAMCGGIATTATANRCNTSPGMQAVLVNVGRISGYTLAGMLVGGLGSIVMTGLRLPGLIQSARALVGVILILAAVRLAFPRSLGWLAKPGVTFWAQLQPLRQRVLPKESPLRPLVLGLFWGWLPCGLSTTLLMAAWLEASALHGGLLMLAFGLGTLPLMTLLSWSGAHFSRYLSTPSLRFVAAGLIASAGLMTLTAPWLVHLPRVHQLLQALGCRALIA